MMFGFTRFKIFPQKISYKIVLFPLAVSGFSLILTIVAVIYAKNDFESQAKREFETACNEIKAKIYSRLFTQSLILQSCSSYISASDSVTREDWKYFIENSKMFQNMFGYQGIAYNEIIQKKTLKPNNVNVLDKVSTSYYQNYAKKRDTITSIIYIQPESKENLSVIGYDTYSEPIRRRAMEYARDFNLSALTSKLILVQENLPIKQAGVIIYTPVYKRNMPINNIKERRAAIIGWVSCPYRMDGLMMNILGPWGLDTKNNKKIHLYIYDNKMDSSSILYDSQKNVKVFHDDLFIQLQLNPILFNEKKWALNFFQPRDQFPYFQKKILSVLTFGTFISFLLFYLSILLIYTWFRLNLTINKWKVQNDLKNSKSS